MLKKDIRKTLVETKKIMEKQLIENKIVQNRMTIIFENVKSKKDYDQLTIQHKIKLTKKFVNEIMFLGENQFLNENFLDSMKSLFGNSFESIVQTMMEPIVGSVLGSLGIKKGKFRNIMVSLITSQPSELLHAMGDCKMMTKLIVRSFIEAEVMFLQQEAGLDGMVLSFMRNKLGSMAENTELAHNLESHFGDAICDVMSNVKNKTEDVIKKLQNGTGDMTSNLIPGL